VFTPGVMRRIVDQIDAHLERRSPLDEMSLGFGLSSGHFARKFEYSAGLSLNRFVNRRRIGIAIGMLAGKKSPLSQLSLDLGFSSQSHFTRMFRGLTGITPGQFRRLQARAQEPE
jgi:AraC family transcriptional regulator